MGFGWLLQNSLSAILKVFNRIINYKRE